MAAAPPPKRPLVLAAVESTKTTGTRTLGCEKCTRPCQYKVCVVRHILLLLIGEENDDVAGGDNISSFPVLAGASSGESPGRANKQMRNNDRYVEIVGCLENRAKLYSHMGIPWKRKILLLILQKHGRFRPCGWDLQELGGITRICPKSFPFTIAWLL